jgi:hypothetical protein
MIYIMEPADPNQRRNAAIVAAVSITIFGLMVVFSTMMSMTGDEDLFVYAAGVLPDTVLCVIIFGIAMLTSHYRKIHYIVPSVMFIGCTISAIYVVATAPFPYQTTLIIVPILHICGTIIVCSVWGIFATYTHLLKKSSHIELFGDTSPPVAV